MSAKTPAVYITLLAGQSKKGFRKEAIDVSFLEFVTSVSIFTVGVLFVVVWPSVEAQLRGG